MAKANHPSYPHPTIVEALCEIHFRLPPDAPWKPTLPGEFFKRIQKEYPEMEPVQDLTLQMEVGPTGVGQRLVPGRARVRFTHREKKRVLQLAESVFTINLLAPYPGWDAMLPTVLDAWKQVQGVLHAVDVTRVGLRYINRVPFRATGERLGDYLVASDYLPATLLRSARGFLLRLESHLDHENRVIVTVGDQRPDNERAGGAALFDIDRITEQPVPAAGSALRPVLNRLHEEVWEIFSASRGEGLERMLRGEA